MCLHRAAEGNISITSSSPGVGPTAASVPHADSIEDQSHVAGDPCSTDPCSTDVPNSPRDGSQSPASFEEAATGACPLLPGTMPFVSQAPLRETFLAGRCSGRQIWSCRRHRQFPKKWGFWSCRSSSTLVCQIPKCHDRLRFSVIIRFSSTQH